MTGLSLALGVALALALTLAFALSQRAQVITSQEKTKTVKNADGSERMVHFRIWNPTVANLTLMALGSSAPEILLSVIEVLSNDMGSGALGPSTIVGSAAFNLMVTNAVCLFRPHEPDGMLTSPTSPTHHRSSPPSASSRCLTERRAPSSSSASSPSRPSTPLVAPERIPNR